MLENKNPLVSIIVITYNSGKYVIETLESAKNQTYKNIELIVSDDKSNDDTVQICNDWIEKNKTHFNNVQLIETDKNTGIPGNCNRGIKAASGDWIKLLAGDDALTENCIENFVKFHKKEPNARIMFSNVDRYNNSFDLENKLPLYQTKALKISQYETTAYEQFQILLRVNKVWANSLFIAKSIFEEYGLYDASLRFWEDRPFLLKVTNQGVKLYYVDIISCKYRKHTESVQKLKKDAHIFSPYIIEKETYYYKNYIKHLTFIEKVCKKILIGRILIMNKLGFNKKNIISICFLKLTSFPWSLIIKNRNRKYI